MLSAWPKLNLGKFLMNSGNTFSPWCPKPRNVRNASAINGVPAAGASHWATVKSSPALSMCCAPVASGRPCRSYLAAPAPSTNTFNAGVGKGSFWPYGKPVWPSMMKWRGLPGSGKALMGRKAKLRWPGKRWAITPLIGGKKGSKRSLLVDGAGVPLSLIVSGANRHDVKLLETTLDSIVIVRPKTSRRRRQNLCADKGYAGRPAAQAMQQRGYTPHVRSAEKKPAPAGRGNARAVGWLNARTRGSTASASCWCAMKRPPPIFWHCCNALQH